MTIDKLLAVFREHLYLPDPSPVQIVLGTVVANLLPGDPVWLLLVGPPSSGKTELLAPLSALGYVHEVSTFTHAGLLSGSRSRRPGATGGLLAELGKFGIIVCKDFTSLLSEAPQTRSELLAALREIYDGSWRRQIGADGGRTLAWKGKAGLLAAVTETIERHTADIGAMGERFIFYRMPPLDDEERLEQARAAANNAGRQQEMRAELAKAVGEFLDEVQTPSEPPALTAEEMEALVMLADLATRCRSPVERDPRDREIELVPQAEAAARMQAVLVQLVRGLRVIGVDNRDIGQLAGQAALDSMTKARRAIVELLLGLPRMITPTSANIADTLGMPTPVVSRTLQDLAAHRVVERHADRPSHRWAASELLRERWASLNLPVRGVELIPDGQGHSGRGCA
jgi:hypothetical protein